MTLIRIDLDHTGGKLAKQSIHSVHAVVEPNPSHGITDGLTRFSFACALNEIIKLLTATRHEFGGYAVLDQEEKSL
ncbi:MAG: hypothetical protein WBV22_08115 [Anaerolineaceae bacterium]